MCMYLFVKYAKVVQGRLPASALLALVATCIKMLEAQRCAAGFSLFTSEPNRLFPGETVFRKTLVG